MKLLFSFLFSVGALWAVVFGQSAAWSTTQTIVP